MTKLKETNRKLSRRKSRRKSRSKPCKLNQVRNRSTGRCRKRRKSSRKKSRRKSSRRKSRRKSQKILYRVINCAIHEKRLKHFKAKAKAADIPNITRVSCINGKKFTDSKFCSMIRDGILNYNAELTPTEVAIFLSHAKCWEQLIDSKAEYMLIFEDDCSPYKDFMKKFNAIMDADLGFDIFWLYNGNWMRNKNSEKKVTTVDKIPIFRETENYNASGSCYLITKKWAKVLYNKMFPIMEPVDNFMGSVRVKTAKHYTVQNKKRKDASFDCFTVSPFMYVACPSESTSTQTYYATEVVDRKLRHCKKK